MSNEYDGFYLIENHVPYSRPEDCLRVIRDGLTWSTLWADVSRVIEFRENGELFTAPSLDGEDGGELRGPLERSGTWAKTASGLELSWGPRKLERLVPQLATRLLPEPPLQRRRGRLDELLGLVIEQRDARWDAKVELDGPTELSLPTVSDLAAAFARAREVLATLRAGALDVIKRDLAAQVFDEYVDYMQGLDRPAQPTIEALAKSLRVDTVALDASGVATLWFGSVLGEHSVLAVLARDCRSCRLRHV